MQLHELFNTVTPAQWNHDGDEGPEAVIVVDGKRYIVNFVPHDEEGSDFDVEFALDTQSTNPHKRFRVDVVGDAQGAQAKVFASVITVVRQFITKYKPHTLNFYATGDSRINLYNAMLRRLSGIWRVVTRQIPTGMAWTLTAPRYQY